MYGWVEERCDMYEKIFMFVDKIIQKIFSCRIVVRICLLKPPRKKIIFELIFVSNALDILKLMSECKALEQHPDSMNINFTYSRKFKLINFGKFKKIVS